MTGMAGSSPSSFSGQLLLSLSRPRIQLSSSAPVTTASPPWRSKLLRFHLLHLQSPLLNSRFQKLLALLLSRPDLAVKLRESPTKTSQHRIRRESRSSASSVLYIESRPAISSSLLQFRSRAPPSIATSRGNPESPESLLDFERSSSPIVSSTFCYSRRKLSCAGEPKLGRKIRTDGEASRPEKRSRPGFRIRPAKPKIRMFPLDQPIAATSSAKPRLVYPNQD